MKRTGYECDRCGSISGDAATWRTVCVSSPDSSYKPTWDLCETCGPALSVWVEDFKRQQKVDATLTKIYPPGVR